MAAYSRATVAHELKRSMERLTNLQCDSETAHAINIVFSHIEHQKYDIDDLTRGVEELCMRLER